ncbi:transcription termination factor [Artemisia annua]|uniref:Transcription termination factor n=1 Tax=Artemisia annua TaxID=35608 RepID=A0A2U1L5D6_ARTAN|nr:transcription termination factor [Artemisia annua]
MTAAIADMQPLALFQVPRYGIVDSRHLMLLPPSSPAHLVCTNPNRPAVHYRSPHRPLSCCYSSSNPLAPPSGSAGDDGDHEDETYYKQKAIDAVSDILQNNGICEEESMEIAMKSPNYVQMLMDSVADLDQLYRSTSSNSSIEQKDGYQKKVFNMGIQKGDKGLVPVLESIVGLPLPSAIHIARYLSSSASHTSTAKILHKVKYVKEILFSDVDGKASIATGARRMMMHLSLSVDEELQHTLSFLEKIQARRGGLDMLVSGDGSFRYLIESFPRLLLLSVESNFKPVVDYLEHIGVPKGRIRNILLLYPPILFYDIDRQIKPTMQLFTKVHGEGPEFGKMLLKYPWILSKSIQKNYQEVITFLCAEKVAEASVHQAIKSWPLLLGCSVGKLKLMIDQFHELGVTEKMLHKVIATSPQLLMQKPREFCEVITYLKGLGLDEESVGRLLGRCPEVFTTNIDKTLKKKVAFLNELGVSKKHLPRVIRKYPEFFVCDVNNSLLPRMRYLKKIGLSKREIAFMVGRFSPLLGYSVEEVLRPKYEFLVNTMQKPLEEVVEYPRYFSYSLEKKIKPRFWVIKGMNCECSLKDMLGRNDEEFAADYMSGLATTVVPPS